MKRKLSALLLTVTLVTALLTGCSGSGSSSAASSGSGSSSSAASSSSGSSSSAASGSSASSGTASSAKYKVAMILNDSVSDGGWGASCYQAMLDSAKKLGWQSAYSENVAQSNWASVMSDYCDQGYSLIFAPGAEYEDAVKQVAAEYPKVDFCVLNGGTKTSNITSVLPDANQIGYMAGALAGLMSKTNSIGFIGGVELDTTKQKLASYEKAAKKVNPKITVHSAYAGSFTDAAKGKEIAGSMVSTYNVDVLFGDASAVDTGAREALGNSGTRFSIGQPGNIGSADSKVIISSVVTDNAALLEQCMKDVTAGTYGNKVIEGNLANGCLSVGTFSSLVSKDVQTKYMSYIDQIKAGTFLG